MSPTPARVTVVTLGVSDLPRSAAFYAAVFAVEAPSTDQGVAFFMLPGVWLSLYPLEKLAEDIGPAVPAKRAAFSGMTLAHNTRSREDVTAVIEHVRSLGARVVKEPHDTFWGGFSGYFADPDGFYWEVVWGPMFDHTRDGGLLMRD